MKPFSWFALEPVITVYVTFTSRRLSHIFVEKQVTVIILVEHPRRALPNAGYFVDLSFVSLAVSKHRDER